MEEIELRPAFQWTCEACGRDHFAAGIIAELSIEERIELARDHGITEFVPAGDWMTMPETVTCPDCGAEYRTRHFHADDFDGEEES